MINYKQVWIAGSVLAVSLAVPSMAFANSCLDKVKQCERSCSKTNSSFMDVLNCKVQDCAIAQVCSKSNRGSDIPEYKKPTYENRETPSRSPRTYTNERSKPRSSRYSNQTQKMSQTRSELKAALSKKGGSEAQKCITKYRAPVAGTNNVWHVKNNCSKLLAIAWCYPRLSDSSRLNYHKCDSTGQFKYSGADRIRAGGVKWLQGSQGAQVKFGVCMDEVVLDGKTHMHLDTERTGPDNYECSYMSYGR